MAYKQPESTAFEVPRGKATYRFDGGDFTATVLIRTAYMTKKDIDRLEGKMDYVKGKNGFYNMSKIVIRKSKYTWYEAEKLEYGTKWKVTEHDVFIPSIREKPLPPNNNIDDVNRKIRLAFGGRGDSWKSGRQRKSRQ